MTTQVQIRGNTQATQEARTLVSRELDVNTTDWRLCVHNGTNAGGVRHVNSFDHQNNEFTYAEATGTNALTASMRIAPNGYVTGACFAIKIANNNTGSVTLNLNSFGAKTLKKFKNYALANLESDDLIAGMIVQVLYDGTYFQVVGGIGLGGYLRQSWTPTTTSGGGTVTAVNEAYYIDFGASVLVSLDIQMTERAFGPNTSLNISGLPFNAETGVATVSSSPINIYLRVAAGSSQILLSNWPTVGSSTPFNFQATFMYFKD
jgi:hypothetical protein